MNSLRNFLLVICIVFNVINVKDLLAAETWHEHKTRHFIIYFKEASENFIHQIGKEAETLFGKIKTNMRLNAYPQWRADKRLKIYVYNDKEDYRKSNPDIENFHWTAALVDWSNKSIKTFPHDKDYFLKGLLPHELGHIFLRESIGMRADIPSWFSEGIASVQEKVRYRKNDYRVKKLIDEKEYISLNDLTSDQRGVMKDFYLVSASVTRYLLLRLPGNKFRNFLSLLKDGLSFDEAIKKATNNKLKDVEDLNQKWIKHIQDNEFKPPKHKLKVLLK